ncbi:MAG: heavy metal-binding domain-containing protein, partial [Candidatus Sulfotelmatobacter sp.]
MSTKPSNPPSTLERDPVCGMNVNTTTAKHVYSHGGKNFYFCCAPCVEKFRADPNKYLTATPPAKSSGLVTLSAAKPAAPTLLRENIDRDQSAPAYVCPMCPEVRENKPGACPSCGMALEPDVPIASIRTEYTCPMHPEIVRPAPGSCP